MKHGFSTRLGGVSEGYFASQNLSFDRGDDKEAVMENFRRIGKSLGVRCEDWCFQADSYDKCACRDRSGQGKGIVKERDYTDVDGLVTNVRRICLVTSYADCVPLYFLDPVHKL